MLKNKYVAIKTGHGETADMLTTDMLTTNAGMETLKIYTHWGTHRGPFVHTSEAVCARYWYISIDIHQKIYSSIHVLL